MENGNKKKQRVDLIAVVPILISLGAKLAALKTFYGWVARVAIVCKHVDECSNNVDPLVNGFGQIYLTVKYI